jgi:hypothetical protein
MTRRENKEGKRRNKKKKKRLSTVNHWFIQDTRRPGMGGPLRGFSCFHGSHRLVIKKDHTRCLNLRPSFSINLSLISSINKKPR